MKSYSPVIIIGMHRSGTSMLARQLHALGIHMGRDLSVNAESRCFQELNRSMLAAASGSWGDISPVLDKLGSGGYVRRQAAEIEMRLFQENAMDPFWSLPQRCLFRTGLGPRHWGWKDPRNSITLPVWLRIFPRAKVIHVIRNGIDAAISLHRRELNREVANRDYSAMTSDLRYCFQLWEQYVRLCREHAGLLPAAQYLELRYEELLQAPTDQLRLVLSFLDQGTNERKLDRVAGTADRGRLDNEEQRLQYSSQIAGLAPSPLMAELGYV